MAISRHSNEWKVVVAKAAFIPGFRCYTITLEEQRQRRHYLAWRAEFSDAETGMKRMVQAHSKFAVCRLALAHYGDESDLPDAAKTAGAPPLGACTEECKYV